MSFPPPNFNIPPPSIRPILNFNSSIPPPNILFSIPPPNSVPYINSSIPPPSQSKQRSSYPRSSDRYDSRNKHDAYKKIPRRSDEEASRSRRNDKLVRKTILIKFLIFLKPNFLYSKVNVKFY